MFFPRSTSNKWRFPWSVTEIPVGVPANVLGLSVVSAEVIHFSGAPSTALRISDGERVFSYSGDTEWTEALLPIARGADLFVVECYDYDRDLTAHMNWTTVKQRLPDFNARRVMLTHMNPTMLAKVEEAKAAGVLVAEDGALHRFVNGYINDEDVRFLGSLEAKIADGDNVTILPAVAGG